MQFLFSDPLAVGTLENIVFMTSSKVFSPFNRCSVFLKRAMIDSNSKAFLTNFEDVFW